VAEQSWYTTDFYEVLGVTPSASPGEITKAYRKLAKKLHPDTNPQGAERFKEVSAAYDVIGTASSRDEYDDLRASPPPSYSSAPSWSSFFSEDASDFGNGDDIFSSFFGNSRSRRGANLSVAITLKFREAVQGTTTTLLLDHEVLCTVCGGSGAAPGTTVTVCSRCHGQGMVEEGPFSLSTVCPVCQGRAHLIQTPCPTCHGQGQVVSTRNVTVRIPPGIEDGQQIRLAGKGQDLPGSPPGDLYVTVSVSPDKIFTREGRHLVTSVSVSAIDAALGTTVEVPTLGSPVTVKVPAGTQPGASLRVRGRGISTPKGTGDLLVRIKVTVPRHLSAHQREVLQSFALSPEKSGSRV
jgi:molecular chaperone DnaJ